MTQAQKKLLSAAQMISYQWGEGLKIHLPLQSLLINAVKAVEAEEKLALLYPELDLKRRKTDA